MADHDVASQPQEEHANDALTLRSLVEHEYERQFTQTLVTVAWTFLALTRFTPSSDDDPYWRAAITAFFVFIFWTVFLITYHYVRCRCVRHCVTLFTSVVVAARVLWKAVKADDTAAAWWSSVWFVVIDGSVLLFLLAFVVLSGIICYYQFVIGLEHCRGGLAALRNCPRNILGTLRNGANVTTNQRASAERRHHHHRRSHRMQERETV